MVIWDTSPPSSGSAGFPNKVTIPYPNNYVGLSCGEQGLLFVAVRGLLIAMASLVAERGL